MDSSVVLGIDIGGTNTVYGFISRDGHIYTHEEIPTRGQAVSYTHLTLPTIYSV